LIGEALDSVLAQTYHNWECLVVDDGSSDATSEIMAAYCAKDSRIQYHQRPADRPKGANACRNYGLEKSEGDYIIWFDSDDKMTAHHVYQKYEAIVTQACDFVVAQTQNFRGSTYLEPYKYSKQPYGITLEDFVFRKISWYTYDVMLVRKVAEQISYNEALMFWQDFNYYCKMLTITTNGSYIDKILTYRRLHDSSIQVEMTATSVSFYQKIIHVMNLTYKDISDSLSDFGKNQLVRANMNTSFVLAKMRAKIPLLKDTFIDARLRLGYVSVILFALSLMSAYVFRKGECILKKAKRS
jgi:glycosyltransferase involved in cell wall biosynthesis